MRTEVTFDLSDHVVCAECEQAVTRAVEVDGEINIVAGRALRTGSREITTYPCGHTAGLIYRGAVSA